MRRRDFIALLNIGILIWVLWVAEFPVLEGIGGGALDWRFVFIGAPSFLVAMSLLHEGEDSGRLLTDEKPFLLLALWAPVGAVCLSYESSAPYWVGLWVGVKNAALGGAVGLGILLAVSVLDRRLRQMLTRAGWTD